MWRCFAVGSVRSIIVSVRTGCVVFLLLSRDVPGGLWGGRKLNFFSMAYLAYLAMNRKVSASTQNSALNAMVFLYKIR